MSRAWVLLTAMPPTKGHIDLVNFACEVAYDDSVEVIVCTQPGEPYPWERASAIMDTFYDNGQVHVTHIHETLPQDPEAPGFQDMWNDILHRHGAKPQDYVVASEPYGIWLAEGIKGRFIPYDPDRSIKDIKAERVRQSPIQYFSHIAPRFQFHLRTNVVLFGAESTGKTTLSRLLVDGSVGPGGHWFFEWARPYLETVGAEITVNAMHDIWRGQRALQMHAHNNFHDEPFHFFDTDLYSTIGYWELPHWVPTLGPVPQQLILDAELFKADLYVICPSNIPFEVDPLRYGGHERESSDQYWIDLAEHYELPYVVLSNSDLDSRYMEARRHVLDVADNKVKRLAYDRGGF